MNWVRRMGKIAVIPAALLALILLVEAALYFLPGDVVRLAALPDGFDPEAPLPEEPARWKDFLDWGESELLRTPPPSPLPAPTLASPTYPLVRLLNSLEQAEILASPVANESGVRVLAEFGPLRSDRAQAGFEILEKAGPEGPLLELKLQGLKLERKDIGRIDIDLRLPSGKSFDLVWGTNTWGPVAERITIPVPDNEKFWPLQIRTQGFANWWAPLESIGLEVPRLERDAVEIQSIRFLGKEALFPESYGAKRVKVGRETRSALYAHCPVEIGFRGVAIPEAGVLQTALAIFSEESVDEGTRLPPAVFEILVREGGSTTLVLERPMGRQRQWHDCRIDLSAWAGRSVDLIFHARSEAAEQVAAWSDPVVYQPQKQAPLVVLYLIDALSAHHINLYGYERETMPRLTAMAKEGVWFDPMFANSTLTYESIPAIFFSLPFERFSGFYNSPEQSTSLIAFAEALQVAGVATGLFSTNSKSGPSLNTDQGFDHAYVHNPTEERAIRTVPIEPVVQWLGENRDRPAFVFIHTLEPHGPYVPPEEFAGKFSPVPPEGPIDFVQSITAAQIVSLKDRYDEEVLFADAQLGRFVEALRSEGYLARSTLFVTADHGEAFGEHGAQAHGSVFFAEVHRIPLVAFGGQVESLGRQRVPAQLFDLGPTILDRFQVPLPYSLAGQSLEPFLRKERPENEADELESLRSRAIYGSNHSLNDRSGVVEYVLVEQARWKLIVRCRKDRTVDDGWPVFQFYDIESDPFERDNRIPIEGGRRAIPGKFLRGERIVTSPADRRLIRAMFRKLIHWRAQNPPLGEASGGQALSFDGDQLLELKNLGYLR